VNIKLESPRGEAIHAADAAFEADPPDVVVWNGRIFRFVRTDGIFDQKKHVYREASVHDLGASPQDGAMNGVDTEAVASAPEPPLNGKKSKPDRQVSAALTAAQAELLKRVKARGAFASPKAALIAGLEALDEKHTLSNDALLKLLAERLTDTRH
jgi:hypothetical protein